MKRERLKARLENLYGRTDRRLGGRLSLLVRTGLAFVQDEGPLAARSIAYYALFAVFPALLALLSVASAVLGSEEAQESVMALVQQYAPMALDVVAANIEQLLATSDTVGLVALVGLIWSASGVASALFQAVNRAWGVQGARLVLSARLYSLVMIFVVGAFLLLALSIGPIVSLARAWQLPVLGWQPSAQSDTDQLASWLSSLAPALFSVCAFILIYRTMPRARVGWRDVWGWNLFGTASMGWTPYLSGVVPYLQIPVLLAGLVAAVALALRTAHQHGQRSAAALPVSLFCVFSVVALLTLYMA